MLSLGAISLGVFIICLEGKNQFLKRKPLVFIDASRAEIVILYLYPCYSQPYEWVRVKWADHMGERERIDGKQAKVEEEEEESP